MTSKGKVFFGSIIISCKHESSWVLHTLRRKVAVLGRWWLGDKKWVVVAWGGVRVVDFSYGIGVDCTGSGHGHALAAGIRSTRTIYNMDISFFSLATYHRAGH